MYKYLCLLLLLLGLGQNAFSQSEIPKKALKLFEEANGLYVYQDKAGAIDKWQKAVEAYPNYYDAWLQLVKVQAEIGNWDASREAALKVLALKPQDAAYVYMHLGKLDMEQLDYPAAITSFKQALEKAPPAMRPDIEQKIEVCQFRINAMKHPVDFAPYNMGDALNSMYDEYLPNFTADGKTILFTRRNGKDMRADENFFIAFKEDSLWQKAQDLGETINTDTQEGALSISPDGRRLFFAAAGRAGSEGNFDIYYSYKSNGTWIRPINIGPPINSPAWESQPCISADGKELFFSSNCPGTIGGRDIWVSKLVNNTWQRPENLGDKINSKEDEQCPFLHPDGKTLYFSSKGHLGMGDADLFMVKRNEKGEWGEAVNLGYPINTNANENSLVISPDGLTAYYAAMTDSAGIDLFAFELPPPLRPEFVTYVQADVVHAQTGESLEAIVEFVDTQNDKMMLRQKTDEQGKFLVTMPVGKNYACTVNKEGFAFYSANFALDTVNFTQPYELHIPLEPLPQTSVAQTQNPPTETHLTLHNIFFETNSYQLLSSSSYELDKMVGLLTENPKLQVEIIGHTDNVGAEDFNLKLSEQRAKSVYDYLVSKGIAMARLQYKGKGESEPIADNNTAEGKAQNRRTEFILR
ncbi:MAG: OmpA family protein [Chitinophagales bacterium]|nr:PD40 domain-containing protein [Bacteroidota bacterium]MCB9043645.1 PD40 domain-containing protein [Chitinophagales bacterium]